MQTGTHSDAPVHPRRRAFDEQVPVLAAVVLVAGGPGPGDGGKTWTKPEETPILSKHVIPTLLRDGAVVVGYQRRFKPNGYRARFTSDLGKTWSEEVVIRDNFEFEDGTRWPLTVELPDGTLYTLMTGLKFGDDGGQRLYVCGSRWSRDYRRVTMPEQPQPPRNPVINAEKAGKSPWK